MAGHFGYDKALFDEEPRPATTREQPAPAQPAPVGKSTAEIAAATPQPDVTATTDTPKPTDPDAREKQLLEQLQKQFVRSPDAAKQTATTLAAEFPAQFSADWVLKTFKDIDDAHLRKTLGEQAQRSWDRRPGDAIRALHQLTASFPRDAALRSWCAAFEKRILNFQDSQRLAEVWDREPSTAQNLARQLHARDPKAYNSRWLASIEQRVWNFQDRAWAMKVTDQELRAWLGEYAIDWDETPADVRARIQSLVGQAKRDASFKPGGGGAKSSATVDAPTDDQRDRMRAAATSGTNFEFKDPTVKRLELASSALKKQADDARTNAATDQNAAQQNNPFGMFGQQDVMTTIMSQVEARRARDLDRASSEYAQLADRIKTGATTLEKERELMRRDVAALDYNIRTTSDEKANASLRASRDQLAQVLADPKGVVPGAGEIAKVLPSGDAWVASKTSDAQSAVNTITDTIDQVTTGGDPYSQGIGRPFNEMAVGTLHFLGRVSQIEEGMNALITDAAAHFLPDSVVSAMQRSLELQHQQTVALKGANTQLTRYEDASQETYVAAGGTVKLIDQITPKKIAEAPDQVALAVVSGIPAAKVPAIAIGAAWGLTEGFFETYAQTRDLGQSLKVAGFMAVQNAASLAISKLPIGNSGQLAASLALTYIVGKAQGLSPDQMQSQIAMTLVLSGVNSATGALANMHAQTRTIVNDMEGKPPTNEPPVDTARDAEIDRVANELRGELVKSHELIEQLQVAQKSKQDTAPILEKLQEQAQVTQAKRQQMEQLYLPAGKEPLQLKAAPTPPQLEAAPNEPLAGTARAAIDEAAPGAKNALTDALNTTYNQARTKTVAEMAVDPVTVKALVDSHAAMFDVTMREGAVIRKVITRAQLDDYLKGNLTEVRGFIGDKRNLESLTPAEIVHLLGLDYDDATYIRTQPGGQVTPVDQVIMLEFEITASNKDALMAATKVPMDPVMVEAITKLAASGDANAKKLLPHLEERNAPAAPNASKDPFTGKGMSTSGDRLGTAGEQLSVNQELRTKGMTVGPGAKIVMKTAKGGEVVIAHFEAGPAGGAGKFVLEPTLPDMFRSTLSRLSVKDPKLPADRFDVTKPEAERRIAAFKAKYGDKAAVVETANGYELVEPNTNHKQILDVVDDIDLPKRAPATPKKKPEDEEP